MFNSVPVESWQMLRIRHSPNNHSMLTIRVFVILNICHRNSVKSQAVMYLQLKYLYSIR